MRRTTQETVVDYLLNDQKLELLLLIGRDPYAQHVFEEEKLYFLIEKYLDGQLLEPDRKAVEYLFHQSQEFREEFEIRRKVNSIENIELQISLEQAHDDYILQRWQVKEENEKITLPITRKRYTKWIAAASIILLLGFSLIMAYNFKSTSNAELFAEYYQPLEDTKGTDFVVNSTALNQAKQNYLDENYLEALSIFRNLPDTLSIHTEKYFFMALTMVELGMYEDAITAFQDVVQVETSECIPQSYWYLALCYLRTNQEDSAKEIFELIVDNQSYNYTRASKILRRL